MSAFPQDEPGIIFQKTIPGGKKKDHSNLLPFFSALAGKSLPSTSPDSTVIDPTTSKEVTFGDVMGGFQHCFGNPFVPPITRFQSIAILKLLFHIAVYLADRVIPREKLEHDECAFAIPHGNGYAVFDQSSDIEEVIKTKTRIESFLENDPVDFRGILLELVFLDSIILKALTKFQSSSLCNDPEYVGKLISIIRST